jgi:hypothetical protein
LRITRYDSTFVLKSKRLNSRSGRGNFQALSDVG